MQKVKKKKKSKERNKPCPSLPADMGTVPDNVFIVQGSFQGDVITAQLTCWKPHTSPSRKQYAVALGMEVRNDG